MRKVYLEQSITQKIQRFESTFFQMLNRQQNLIDSMTYSGSSEKSIFGILIITYIYTCRFYKHWDKINIYTVSGSRGLPTRRYVFCNWNAAKQSPDVVTLLRVVPTHYKVTALCAIYHQLSYSEWRWLHETFLWLILPIAALLYNAVRQFPYLAHLRLAIRFDTVTAFEKPSHKTILINCSASILWSIPSIAFIKLLLRDGLLCSQEGSQNILKY